MSITEGTILRITQNFTFPDGGVMQNVYNVTVTGGSPPYDVDDIVDDCVDYMEDIYTEVIGSISSNVSAGETEVYEYDSVDDDWDQIGSGVPTLTFTGSANELPRGVAALVRANGIDVDYQGKKYIGGVAEAYHDPGGWTSGFLADLADLALVWITAQVGAASGATLTPGIWSVTDTVFKAFGSAALVNAIAAYQRRRKPGVGI